MDDKQFKALVGKLDRIIALLEAQNLKAEKLVGTPKAGSKLPMEAKLAQGLDGFG